jgi:hypothetical protein
LDDASFSGQDYRRMHSRREFLQAGIAASILPVAVPERLRSAAAQVPLSLLSPSGDRPVWLVCDVRFAQAAALASDAERRGQSVARIDGDITDFWFNELSLRWKEAPIAVAGLTAEGPLFCLERWAWDCGLRVVARDAVAGTPAAGGCAMAGELVSWVIAPKAARRV